MTGTYLTLSLICALLIVWPEETSNTITGLCLKAQIYLLNLRMRWMAWRTYRRIVKVSKEAGLPSPGPFQFTNIWDRDNGL